MARGFSRPVASVDTDDAADTDSVSPSSRPDIAAGSGSGSGSAGDESTITENAIAPATAAIWIFLSITAADRAC